MKYAGFAVAQERNEEHIKNEITQLYESYADAFYQTDGSVLMDGAAIYLFSRRKEGWRVVSMATIPADNIVKCGA